MSAVQWAHLLAFGFAVVGCLLACLRASDVTHRETRLGLYGLLVTSGLWAGAYLVTFLTSSLALATAAYQVGLVCGIATVGAWLYFCSAYAGESYHRQPLYRRGALVTFLGIVAVKLTNGVHEQYFAIEMTETPFAHASVTLFGVHWAVTVLAYALSAVGFYMLLGLFDRSPVPTTGLGLLVGLMALPALVNALAVLGVPGLVAANYEPVAVAAFALGTLYVTEDTFKQVRWAGYGQVLDEIDEAVLLLDEAGRIYQYNAAAEELLPSISPGEQFEAVLGELEVSEGRATTPAAVEDAELLVLTEAGSTRYYLLHETELTIGPHEVGRAAVLSDVTELERQRRELERQSEQLEGFAAAVAHELRNSLTVIEANLTLVGESIASSGRGTELERVGRMSDAVERMTEVICDLTTIGRLSQPVSDPQPLAFRPTVTEALGPVEGERVDVTVDGEGRLWAETTRFTELLRNAKRLAVETGATELRVCLTDEGFELRTDGESLAERDTEAVFEYGTAVPNADAGMLGPNIRSLAQAHGWTVAASTPRAGGIVITVSEARVERDGHESATRP